MYGKKVLEKVIATQNTGEKLTYTLLRNHLHVDDNGITTVYGLCVQQHIDGILKKSYEVKDFSSKKALSSLLFDKLWKNEVTPTQAGYIVEDFV